MQQTNLSNSEQFKQSFREEAREILVDLEAALLELGNSPSDTELVGRVFRGLHTIKGSGSMFGFEQLASFTHNLENAFDAVRNGRLAIDSALIDITLGALDQMRALLDEDEAAIDSGARTMILAQLAELTGQPSGPNKPGPAASAPPAPAPAADGLPTSTFKIRFQPGPEFMNNGANPLLLIRELSEMGTLRAVAIMDQVASLEDLEAERCYVGWELTLETTASLDAIRDVFIFVEDLCELEIEALDPLPASPVAQPLHPKPASLADAPARGLEEPRGSSGGRRAYDKPDNVTSLRVPAARLDQFMDLIGELVTVQARLSQVAAQLDDPEVSAVSEEIERLSSSLRETSMTIRMLPIRGTFEKFRRLVHDLAHGLGKEVDLTIEGAETELDKTVIDQLGDPLMHLIRNSMDHGIESAEHRVARGKQPTARIHLAARHSGASVHVSVADDGRGIDAAAVKAKAIERGLIAADAQLTEAETFALLFEPGFSTAKTVTDVSGRGVGMDVVRQRVESLRGTIDVVSHPGEGTTVTLRLPLTLAIIDGLLVRIADGMFVLPLASTLECIELSAADAHEDDGRRMVNVRGQIVPYIRLREYFNIQSPRPSIEQIMVVETEDGRYGFAVDEVLGDCQTVIKSLGRFYRHVQMVSGATILGDGTVALILDPQRMVQDALKGVRGSSTATTGSRRPKDTSS
jgi:two-component system chemotaxis sensor kinase CheA